MFYKFTIELNYSRDQNKYSDYDSDDKYSVYVSDGPVSMLEETRLPEYVCMYVYMHMPHGVLIKALRTYTLQLDLSLPQKLTRNTAR